jgi:hypothetical protein
MRRTAERAVFVASLSQLPAHLAKVYEESDPVKAKRMVVFYRRGVFYSRSLLDSAHGNPRPRLPPEKDIGVWEAAALKLMAVAQRADPQWFRKWPGPVRNRLTGKGSRP